MQVHTANKLVNIIHNDQTFFNKVGIQLSGKVTFHDIFYDRGE